MRLESAIVLAIGTFCVGVIAGVMAALVIEWVSAPE